MSFSVMKQKPKQTLILQGLRTYGFELPRHGDRHVILVNQAGVLMNLKWNCEEVKRGKLALESKSSDTILEKVHVLLRKQKQLLRYSLSYHGIGITGV
jgi:hypothetical protein